MKRPCEVDGQVNTNICVAEGCYAESCLERPRWPRRVWEVCHADLVLCGDGVRRYKCRDHIHHTSGMGSYDDYPCESGCKPSEGDVCGGPRCT